VLLGLELVVVDVLHDALLVEHVCLPPRQRPEQVGRDPPLLAHLVPVVAQQRVRQPVLLRERLVRRRVVAADADHFRPGLLELLVRVTERARLRYAPTRFKFFFYHGNLYVPAKSQPLTCLVHPGVSSAG
jgi:hypothetical protein